MPPVQMSQATIENLLRWNTDLASVNQAVAANQKVVQSSAQGSAALASQTATTTAATAAGGLLARAWDANSIAARGFLQELTQIQAAEAGLTAETVALTAAQKAQAAFVTRQGAGGGLGRGITKAGRALFNLPDIGGVSTPVSRLLIAGGGGIEAANLSLAALGTTAAVAVPLVLGLVAAAGDLGKASEESARRAKTFADAYTQALEAGTTAAVQELIKRQQNEIAIAEATTKILQQKAADAPQQLSNFLERTSGDLSQRLEQAASDIGLGDTAYNPDLVPAAQSQEAYNAQIEELQKIVEQGKIALEAYLAVFGEGILLTGDAAAAEQELADIRKQLAEARKNQQLREVDAILAAERLTSEERQARLPIVRAEIDLTQQFIDAGGASVETQLELIDRQKDLQAEYYALTSVTDSYADKLERIQVAQEVLATQTDNYFDALEREGDVRDRITAITQDLNDALVDASQKIANANIDKLERLAEVEAESADRRLEIAQDSADRIARLEAHAAYDRFVAIANRDSVAFDQAKRQAELQKKDQEDADKKQIERLDKQLTKQEATIEKSNARTLRSIEDAYNREVTIKNRALQQANVDLQNLTYAQNQIALYGANNQRLIHTQMWTDLSSLAAAAATNIANGFRNIISSIGVNASAQGYNYSAGQFPSSFNSGTQFGVYDVATQAARDYVHDVFSQGRWITAN